MEIFLYMVSLHKEDIGIVTGWGAMGAKTKRPPHLYFRGA